MKKFIFLPFAVVIFFTACNNQSQVTDLQKTVDSLKAIIAQDHSSEAADIIKLDSSWSAVSAKGSAEDWLNYYASDAIMMPPGEAICTDAASREASIKKMFATPGLLLTFNTTKAEVSKSGDLGYADGLYQMVIKDPKGKDYHETGKYSEVWKKRADGAWKCVSDIWNADSPAK